MYNREVTLFAENGKTISLWSLAWPLLIQTLLSQFINTAGVAVLSGFSDIYVTAISVSDQIMNLPRTVIEAISTGMVIVASISLGRRDENQAAFICGCGVLMALAISIIIGSSISAFAPQVTGLMSISGETARLCSEYLRISALVTFPVQAMFAAYQKLLICNGNSKIIPISSGITGILNALLSYVVLYSIKLPVSDITALAIKTTFAWLVGFAIIIIVFYKIKCPIKFGFNFSTAGRIVKIGIPAGMCHISFQFANIVTTGFIAKAGEMLVTAKVYINNILTYIPLITYSISNAMAVIIGRFRGAGKFKEMITLFRQMTVICVVINAALSVLCLIFIKPLVSIFTTDSSVLSIATVIMLVDIPLEILRAVNHCSENALNPNGDVKITLAASIVAAWAFSVLLGYILCLKAGLGLVGVWIAFMINELFKAVVYLIRWRSGKWQETKI